MAIELTTANVNTLSAIRASLNTWDINNFLPLGEFEVALSPYGNAPVTVKKANGPCVIPNAAIGASIARFAVYALNDLTSIVGGQYLTGIAADVGTNVAINIANNNLNAAALNQFFTDLPAAAASPITINVYGNPGAGTCDTTIATGKGYTVTT